MSIIEKYDYYSIIAALLWGINYIAVKSVLAEIPESAFLAIRFTIAVVILLLYLIVTKEGIGIERSDIGKILLLGVLGVGIYNIIWTTGIHLTTASNAALIISTSPLFAQLYVELIHKEKIEFKRWIFTCLSFYGVFLMISQSPGANFDFHSRFFVGNLIIFVSALLFAAYTLFSKPLLNRYSPVKLNALTMASGLPVLIVYCILNGTVVPVQVSWIAAGKMFYIIVCGTVAAYICWYTGIEKTGPLKVILFHYIVPVSSMILGVLFLREPLNLFHVFGGILALGGIIAAKLEPTGMRANRP
jgi:drug/metabolite transporter (DMT)-like permease